MRVFFSFWFAFRSFFIIENGDSEEGFMQVLIDKHQKEHWMDQCETEWRRLRKADGNSVVDIEHFRIFRSRTSFINKETVPSDKIYSFRNGKCLEQHL